MNTNFKIIDLTRLEIKPKSTAPEADALTTRPSEQLSGIARNFKLEGGVIFTFFQAHFFRQN